MSNVRTCHVCLCTEENCSGCVARTGEPCSWVEDDLCSACRTFEFPRVMTSAVAEVLGMPNFRAGPVAHVFRAAGFEINRRAEDEQAFVLHRFLPLAILHGERWQEVALKDIDLQIAKAKTRHSA